ncbi:uncharacterized protein PRCAT00003132001 [Priceomyces carsonii]|uniref:uncharacterized protein n=1 Tax=Priceomyces carsonii TaxID=28549 RepID=UPI002ED88433|nr:unnamed protein product [Priceomyces carsonii]
MNFLSKTFSTLTGSSIPYTLKEKVADPLSGFPNNRSIWTVYNGSNPKQNNMEISIFEFNLKDPKNLRDGHDLLARNSFKKLRSIKFPGIIPIIDFIENENFLYIITERLQPLYDYLINNKERISTDAKLLGLFEVGQTLAFLNQTCNCLLGNLDLFTSVYVDNAGSWKLFGFELATSLVSDPEQPIYRLSNRMPSFNECLPPDVSEGGIESIKASPIKFDSFKYGVLIYLILSNHDFNSLTSSFVTQPKLMSAKLPHAMLPSFKRLINAKPNLRITIGNFLKETASFFERNTLIKFDKQLEEVKYKSNEEKLEFFRNELSLVLDGNDEFKFPPGLLENRLIPQLIDQFRILSKSEVNYPFAQEALGTILNHLLKFGASLPESSFNKLLKPTILQAYALPDRTIRLTLLGHLPSYVSFLTDFEVQQNIFHNMLSGFQDSNFVIRETTLKSITEIVDKISTKQVNQDLLKILAKSQMDPKPSIRVNTLVLIIKISDKIYNNSRNNVLITALSKSLRDSFVPCKLAALTGFESLINVFSLDEICGKILGHLAIALMDPKSQRVRSEAKRVFSLYFQAVERNASNLPTAEPDDEDEEKEFFRKYAPSTIPEAEKTSAAPTALFGWNIVNKLVSASAVEGEMNKEFNSSTPDLTRSTTPDQHRAARETHRNIPPKQKPTPIVNFDEDAFDDGWGMDSEEEPLQQSIESLSVAEATSPSNFRAPARPEHQPSAPKKPTARLNNVRQHSKSHGLKLESRKAKKPTSALKLNLIDNDDQEDNWDSGW